ncbi:MAG TPA: tRNA (adenosine(37)-N6)-threonylcarbamoyltransferase complex dimerization subunit type 1 TsaB [Terracidiphilus sp.]
MNSTRQSGFLVLAIDTCGPTGSVALAQVTEAGSIHLLGQCELAGRTYSATLVAAVANLLASASLRVAQLHAIVAVSGPGSFTGVRVGLSAVKGLAEPSSIPVVAVSRLAVMAHTAAIPAAALDAHRHEIFLCVDGRESLAGAAELAALNPPPNIAVCEDAAAALLAEVWSGAALVRVAEPTAADAIALAVPLILSKSFANLAELDGHYLRRSDAEIFGEKAAAHPA